MISLYEAYSAVLHVGSDPARVEPRVSDPFVLRAEAGRARAEVLAKGVAAVKTWFARARAEAAARQGRQALARLDDRLLADIGVSRGQIPYLMVAGGRIGPAANDDQPAPLAGCA